MPNLYHLIQQILKMPAYKIFSFVEMKRRKHYDTEFYLSAKIPTRQLLKLDSFGPVVAKKARYNSFLSTDLLSFIFIFRTSENFNSMKYL